PFSLHDALPIYCFPVLGSVLLVARFSPPVGSAHIAYAGPCRNHRALFSALPDNQRSPSHTPSSRQTWRRVSLTHPRYSDFFAGASCNLLPPLENSSGSGSPRRAGHNFVDRSDLFGSPP